MTFLALVVSLLNVAGASRAAAASFEAFAIAAGNMPRQSYRQRLTLAANSAANRCTFRSWELAEREALRVRRIRCEIHQENAGITGRAVF